MDDQFLRNPEVRKLIKGLRGGGWNEIMIGIIVLIFAWQMLGITGFQVAHPSGTTLGPANGGRDFHNPQQCQKGGGRITVNMFELADDYAASDGRQVASFIKNDRSIDLVQLTRKSSVAQQ